MKNFYRMLSCSLLLLTISGAGLVARPAQAEVIKRRAPANTPKPKVESGEDDEILDLSKSKIKSDKTVTPTGDIVDLKKLHKDRKEGKAIQKYDSYRGPGKIMMWTGLASTAVGAFVYFTPTKSTRCAATSPVDGTTCVSTQNTKTWKLPNSINYTLMGAGATVAIIGAYLAYRSAYVEDANLVQSSPKIPRVIVTQDTLWMEKSWTF